jgi:hypothetical protein
MPINGKTEKETQSNYYPITMFTSLGVNYSMAAPPSPEPVVLKVYGAQESILRNEFRLSMQPGGPVR